MKNLLFILLFLLTVNLFSQQVNTKDFIKRCYNVRLHKNSNFDKYDIYFVKLDLSVSDDTTYLSGNATIKSTSKQTLDTLVFELNETMEVDSLLINDSRVNFNHDNHIIEYIFTNPLPPNTKFTAQIHYKGTPTKQGRGVMSYSSEEWGKNSTWTLSESFHAYEWWPCKQVLSDKIDSAYMFFTCDNDCKVGSNGLLTNVVNLDNNKKRFEWKTFHPMNYYMLSFAVAEYQDYSIYAKPQGVDSVLIQNFIFNTPECLAENRAFIDSTIIFLEFFSEKFGLYPFANEKYGHCLTALGGGMEHQTMTTIGYFYHDIISHELGHMWFGDYVTCASWQDIWINEGFASYSEYIALENLSNPRVNKWLTEAHDLAMAVTDKSIYIPFSESKNEFRIFHYNLSYKKGAFILHTLRHEINDDELFFSSIREYLRLFANSVATGDDFKNVMESQTGTDLDPFFDQWYYGKGFPIFSIQYTQNSDSLLFIVEQTTSSQATPLFQLHVDYKILYADGDTTVRLFQSKNVETFKIPIREKVTDIIVDPDNWILNKIGVIDSIPPINSKKDLFKFSPNPAKDFITIKFNPNLDQETKKIEVISLGGQIINRQETKGTEINMDITNLENGIYFIKVMSVDITYSKKLVKY